MNKRLNTSDIRNIIAFIIISFTMIINSYVYAVIVEDSNYYTFISYYPLILVMGIINIFLYIIGKKLIEKKSKLLKVLLIINIVFLLAPAICGFITSWRYAITIEILDLQEALTGVLCAIVNMILVHQLFKSSFNKTAKITLILSKIVSIIFSVLIVLNATHYLLNGRIYNLENIYENLLCVILPYTTCSMIVFLVLDLFWYYRNTKKYENNNINS